MDSQSIRKTFLDFFVERGHTLVPSSSLVPDDPTLLFTSAGMVQFKPYYLGEREPPFPTPRATSAQKVLRAVDLEEVGKDARHLSFFEMLGNFSFGDYFKREAVQFAWELATKGFGLDSDRLWASVFETDDESGRAWENDVGLPRDRVLRLATDFWDMGVAGPCGPCSHLYYDRGDKRGREFIPGTTPREEFDEERYFEIWNLVFIQNLQNDKLEVIGDLPKKNVDTGMGLERMAVVLQEVPTVFDIDTLGQLLAVAEKVTGKHYGDDPAIDVSLRVMAEHSRGSTFAIADGVVPSNEERGYVLRRLIRRAVRYARLAEVDEPVLLPLIDKTIELYGDTYSELEARRDLIRRVVEREESQFDRTLRAGLGMLEEEISKAKTSNGVLSGETTFRLHDTYGFPLDMTTDIASDEGLSVDIEKFNELMKAQRERARSARYGSQELDVESKELKQILATADATEFLAYEELAAEAVAIALISNLSEASVLEESAHGELVLDKSPFYPEGGGQVGDRGEIRTETGTFRVLDTKWGVPGIIVHIGEVTSGEIRKGQSAVATVEPQHRDGVRQSHTATHVLHWALRHNLGEHARQQGSLVEPGRLRFDFSHFESVSTGRLSELEEEINTRVLTDDPVRAFETTYDYAMSIGAMALFGEKYGEYVRVVEVGDYSKELCGGTHVHRTGQLGVVTLVTEASVGAGLRRVEAYTGMAGLRYLNSHVERLKQAAELLKVTPDKVVEQIERTLEARKALEAQLSRQQSISQKDEVRSILSENVKEIGNSRVVVIRRDGREVDDLRKLAIELRKELGSGVVVIGSSQNARANLVAASSRDLLDRGVSSKDLLASGARILGGGAGGKPDLAVAGGPKSEEIERAMSAVEAALKEALELR